MNRADFLASVSTPPLVAALPSIVSSIAVAVVGPQSGPGRSIGLQIEAGVRGAVDALNNYGLSASALAQSYVVRTFDDQNAVANAVLQAQFATGDSSVIAAIGHVSGDATLAAIPTYASAQMALIVPTSTDDRITNGTYRNVFRLPTKDSVEGALFARAIIKQYRPKTPYLFVQNADYGADVANGFIDAMSDAKVETKYQQFTYEKPDFAAIADKAIATAPDYCFFAGTAGDMGGLLPALRAKGYTGPIGASQGFFDAGTLKLGAAASDLMVSTSMPYLAFAPTAVRAVNDYQLHHGALSPAAAFGYAAMQIVASVSARNSATARNTLLNALHTGQPVESIVGAYSFAGGGDTLDPQIYFYTVRDGKFAYLHQAHPSAFTIK